MTDQADQFWQITANLRTIASRLDDIGILVDGVPSSGDRIRNAALLLAALKATAANERSRREKLESQRFEDGKTISSLQAEIRGLKADVDLKEACDRQRAPGESETLQERNAEIARMLDVEQSLRNELRLRDGIIAEQRRQIIEIATQSRGLRPTAGAGR